MLASDTTLKRFHADVTHRFGSNHPPAASDDTATVRAASLLLGIELRGWLSTREKEYLDSLAPDNALAFLVLGSEYLHPAEISLFPIDLIDDTITLGGDAVFSHRFSPADGRGNGQSRVCTGVIGAVHGKPLVLGMFGPDSPTDKHLLENRFEQVIGSFRAARQSVRLLSDALKPAPDGSARILVNRASGRVLHVDQTICDTVNKPPFDFVSREYGTVEQLLRPMVRRHRMKMENLTGGCLHVACLTFTPAAKASTPVRLHTSLVDSLLGDIAGITSSAEYLHSQSDTIEVEELRSLAGQMARTGRHITSRLSRYRILANFDRLESEPVNVLSQLEQAVDRLAQLGDRGVIMHADDPFADLTRTAPRDAWLLLFESILELHRTAPGRVGPTEVELEPNGNSLHINFTTEIPGAIRVAELERLWHQETDKLAARLGAPLQRKLLLESNAILTRVTVCSQENQA